MHAAGNIHSFRTSPEEASQSQPRLLQNPCSLAAPYWSVVSSRRQRTSRLKEWKAKGERCIRESCFWKMCYGSVDELIIGQEYPNKYSTLPPSQRKGDRHKRAGTNSRNVVTMNDEGDAKQGISREGPLRSITSPPFAG